jgi:hypothetical protein
MNGNDYKHVPDFEATHTKAFARLAVLAEGSYYLILQDQTMGLLSEQSSDIKITIGLINEAK